MARLLPYVAYDQTNREAFVNISNIGQEYAAIQPQSGQVLRQPESETSTSVPLDSDRVTISPKGASREASALKAHEKYTAAIERINQNSAPNGVEKGDSAGGLSSLPPLEFFNEDDVNAYENRLMAELTARGIDTSIPIRLNTDFQGKVVVIGDHPDKAAIEQVFEDDMDLRNGFVQSANFFLFKEIASLHQQWSQKIESGVTEEVANLWLISAVQNSVSKSSRGLSLENGSFNDPFGDKGGVSPKAMKAYQA